MKIAVVGTGLVGHGWAIAFARAGHEVALFDAKPGQSEAALRRIDTILPELVSFGLIESDSDLRARIAACQSLETAVDGSGYVQESGPERVSVKREIFAELDRIAAPETILATSSSGIPISAIAEPLGGRARCLVAHPANPPYLLPIVEIVPAPWTSEKAIAAADDLLSGVGQVTVRLKKEIDGFVLNRLQGALLHEAFRLVEDGIATAEDVDRTVCHGLGLRWSFMGPFETIDLNAPGGIADYVDRLGPMYLRFAQERGAARPWGPELVARIEADRRESLPASALADRAAWRDRRLMALSVHKKAPAAGAADVMKERKR